MKRLTYIVLVIFLFVFLMGCSSFPHIDSGIFEASTDDAHVRIAFSDHDRRFIHDYYRSKKMKRKDLPPGLAKRDALPPGLQKQIRKNGKLPYGLAKRSLPSELEEHLSPIPRGYVRLKVGGDIILMNDRTQVIVDIIHDIG